MIREKLNKKGKRKAQTYKGVRIIEASEKTKDEIQDESEVLIIGLDWIAPSIPPSLTKNSL